MALTANPFIVLSYVGGPALLTNASSLFVLSTSNRFARAVDRSRHLAHLLSGTPSEAQHAAASLELADVGRRVVIIARAMSFFYFAAAAFGLATLSSIAGAVLADVATGPLFDAVIIAAVACGGLGFAAFVSGSILLVVESRIAVRTLAREADAALHLVRRRTDR